MFLINDIWTELWTVASSRVSCKYSDRVRSKIWGLPWKQNGSPQIFWQVFTDVNGSPTHRHLCIFSLYLCIRRWISHFPPLYDEPHSHGPDSDTSCKYSDTFLHIYVCICDEPHSHGPRTPFSWTTNPILMDRTLTHLASILTNFYIDTYVYVHVCTHILPEPLRVRVYLASSLIYICIHMYSYMHMCKHIDMSRTVASSRASCT